jgi:hypothetical protein
MKIALDSFLRSLAAQWEQRTLPALILVFFSLMALNVRADTVNLGVFSFDVLNPASPGSAGVNSFSVDNLTGATFDLPPDFPALDDLTFLGVNVTINLVGGPDVVPLGDLGPGFYSPAAASLEFLDSDQVSSASLDATLGPSQFALADGDLFELSSQQLSATLLPSSGNALTAGVDLVLITVSGTEVAATVPEPDYAPCFLIAAFVFVRFAKRRFRLE